MTDEQAKDVSSIEQAFRHWNEEVVAKVAKRFPERRDKFVTASGAEVQRLYIPKSCATPS